MSKWISSSAEAYKRDKSKPDSIRFYNMDGTITQYAFSCGYIETYSTLDEIKAIHLCYRSGGFYEIEYIGKDNLLPNYETFTKLTDARKRVIELKSSL